MLIMNENSRSALIQRIMRPLVLFGSGLLFLLSTFPYAEAAKNELQGTFFVSTRLIYPEDARQGKSIVLNNNSDKDFLLQAYVSQPDTVTSLPTLPGKEFLVTPPLVHLPAHQTQTLRLLRTGGDFPTDRESVFFLTARLIPNEGGEREKNASGSPAVVKYLTALSVKGFWRPQGLDKPNAVEEAAGKLTAKIMGDVLSLKNPTPYYVTLRTLSIGGANVPTSELVHLIPPFGIQSYRLPTGMKRTAVIPVVWTAIKENGFDTAPYLSPVDTREIVAEHK